MSELKVPWLRRWLMWTAVAWATLFTSLVPGRRSRPVLRWIGRVVAIGAVLGAIVLLIVSRDRTAVLISMLGVPAVLLLAGTIALGRPDRALSSLLMYPVTLIFSPLLVTGGAIALILLLYLAIEDVCTGLPTARRLWRNLTSREAKLANIATPQFARLAAVLES
jgi:hypothetical protein